MKGGLERRWLEARGRDGRDVHRNVVGVLVFGRQWLGIPCGRVQRHGRREGELEVQVLGLLERVRLCAYRGIAFSTLSAEEGWDGKVSVEFGVTEESHAELTVEDACLEVWRGVSLLFLEWSFRCVLLSV